MHYEDIRPIYFLRKWKYFETARYDLNDIELKQAKIFFNALKRINETDRKILADAFYYSNDLCSFNSKTGYYHSLRPIRNDILAQKYCVTADRMGFMRRGAMRSLKKEMQEIMKNQDENWTT